MVDIVSSWAAAQPDKVAYTYVSDTREQAITYAELDARARAIAGTLRAKYEPGTTALLLLPLGLDFVEAFFGCLYAGVVAVPMHNGRSKSARARLATVALDCGARCILTASGVAAGLAEELRDDGTLEGLAIIETDRAASNTPAPRVAGALFRPAPGALAFLQYTSGSTSDPKGTMVTHQNIMANQAMLKSVFHTDDSTVIASWLPIFHDMGLIGNVLHAAYLGAHAVLISTLSFIKSPLAWLRAIDRYKATFSGGPNFAYDLCVAKITREQRAGLDLSSWRVAFNGAEPVRKHTLEAFSNAFASSGFRRSAFVPTYGLAEATLVVSGTIGEGPRYFEADAKLLKENELVRASASAPAQALVSTGHCEHGDQHVVIVDPETLTPCSSSQVGEIWITGSHIAKGYWRKDAATRETFQATLPGDGRRYLRTGDLGFVRDESLFITGRLKDMMIFRGQNVYPQDIELTVELACPQVRPGCTAAFSAGPQDGAGVVVVAELERGEEPDRELLAHTARQVQEIHEVPLHQLVLVRRNSVPKTTSGKIQRSKCKQEYESGAYDILAQWQNPALRSANDLAEQVMAHAAQWLAKHQQLAVANVDYSVPFAAFGIDSIQKVALIHSLENRFGIVIPESSFFALEAIADLKQFIIESNESETEHRGEPAAPAQGAPAAATARRGAAVLPAFSAMSWGEARRG